MMHLRWIAFAVLALALVGCASKGAGTTQDPCGLAQVQEAAPAELVQQQQQALQSGQKASNQPVQSDPARWSPGTTWGAGAGATTAENTWMEDRSQAGAPSSNMMLVQPASQEQSQAAGGTTHPQIRALDRQLKAANMRLCVALSSGNMAAADKEYALIADLNERYAQAVTSTAKNVTITYNFEGAFITQGMSSSSTASGKPGSASTSDEGTSVTPTAAELVEKAGARPSTFPPAVAVPDSSPDVPPAGVAVPE